MTADQLANLDHQNAQFGLEGIRTAFGQELGLVGNQLQNKGLNIQRRLGMGDLRLRRDMFNQQTAAGNRAFGLQQQAMEQDRALQELLWTLQIQQGNSGI
jgi:hypothetical protein